MEMKRGGEGGAAVRFEVVVVLVLWHDDKGVLEACLACCPLEGPDVVKCAAADAARQVGMEL